MTERALELDSAALERILDVTRQLSAPIELNTILTAVLEAACEVLDAERGTVFLYDAEHDELCSKVATGAGEIRFPADRGIAGECVQASEIINVCDAYADPRFNPQVDRETGFRTRCLLTVPLIGLDEKLVGVMQLLNKREDVFDHHDERVATALASQCAVALQRARLIEDYVVKEKLERDLSIARDIQQGVLPRTMPEFPGYDIAAWGEPADQTGGDIYDLCLTPDGKLLVMMADATGHGVGPAISVTQVRAMLRIALRCGANLDTLFTHINEQLVEDLADNRFVTAFIGLLDPLSHALPYHSGGQAPLVHYHAAEDRFDILPASSYPMGIIGGVPPVAPDPIAFGPGDIFALISDGIFEAPNKENEQFGEDRVQQVIRKYRDAPMKELVVALRQAVAEFAAADRPQADDMTMLLLKRS
ncbi:MAG: GAF domain-containing SpoIIE family protein phosphatase [Phycisphaeraceae bacterium]